MTTLRSLWAIFTELKGETKWGTRWPCKMVWMWGNAVHLSREQKEIGIVMQPLCTGEPNLVRYHFQGFLFFICCFQICGSSSHREVTIFNIDGFLGLWGKTVIQTKSKILPWAREWRDIPQPWILSLCYISLKRQVKRMTTLKMVGEQMWPTHTEEIWKSSWVMVSFSSYGATRNLSNIARWKQIQMNCCEVSYTRSVCTSSEVHQTLIVARVSREVRNACRPGQVCLERREWVICCLLSSRCHCILYGPLQKSVIHPRPFFWLLVYAAWICHGDCAIGKIVGKASDVFCMLLQVTSCVTLVAFGMTS